MRFLSAASVRRLLAVVALLGASAQAHASLMLAQPPYRPKDFAILKKGGEFHIFYIRHDITKPTPQTERDFGHAVSSDMYSWTQLPPVIPVRDSNWDNLHVWAPSIVERDSVYYMFYTGVTDRPEGGASEQRLGLATSTDLMNWNRLDEPIFSCRDAPWSWCDTLNNNNGFRDPFVMEDPSVPGQWLMYYSAFPAADTAGMIIGVAASTGDFTQWNDLMPLWATNRQYSYNDLLESPHLFKHGDLWFLFFTSNAGQPLSYFVTFSPTGPINNWFNRGRLSNMLGLDTRSWSASEYLKDGTNEYFAFANFNRVEMYKMMWTGTETFQLFEPGNFHIRSMSWDADSVQKGQKATLSVVATGWVGREAELAAVEKLPGGGEESFAIENVGIPALLPLTADTTRFEWTSTILHSSGDTTTTQTIVIRAADLTAQAYPIAVTPVPHPPPPFAIAGLHWSADSAFVGEPVTLSVVAQGWSGHVAQLGYLERPPGGVDAALDPDSLGLPTTLPLVADTTRLAWTTRIRRGSGDTTTVLDLVALNPAFTLESPVLRIQIAPPPPPFKVESIRWSTGTTEVGMPVSLTVATSHWSGHQIALEAVERLPGGGDSTIAIADLGLPPALTVTADTMHIAWVARIERASGDLTTDQALVVRAADHSAESQPLLVSPALLSGDPGGGTIEDRRLRFRLLGHGVFGERASFLVDLPRAGRARLDIYDLQGRRVRTLADRDLPVGANVFAWDGRDAGGSAVGRGLYFARLSLPSGSLTVKVVLTRPAGAP